MNTDQINKILERNRATAPYYLGCFPADKISINSLNSPFPQSMVINFDPSNEKGTHWVAIFAESPRSVEYYDSLGIWPPLNENISLFLSEFKLIHFNPYAFQSIRSKNCGKHAIFFLYNRSLGKSLDQILDFLSKISSSGVDRFVNNFVDKKIFNK